MSDTQVLLGKIAALRQRLEQSRTWTPCSGEDQDSERDKEAPPSARWLGDASRRVKVLERQLAAVSQHARLLDGAFRQLETVNANEETTTLPARLTARARRLLGQGQEMLVRSRGLGERLETLRDMDDKDPLWKRYRSTLAMLDTALRMVQAYPNAPSVQLQLCEGLEATLQVVDERLTSLTDALEQRRRAEGQVSELADLLARVQAGTLQDIQPFVCLAETLLAEAQQGEAIRFSQEQLHDPPRYVAGHSLTVAQVAARLARHDGELRNLSLEAVVAALLHDIGMLQVPTAVLTKTDSLTSDERRLIERHTFQGAEMVVRVLPSAVWLAEAVGCHHERLDGTGYPNGMREMQLVPLVRFLAVCDVYVALCSPRPHRPAVEPRSALTDTLLLAEQGTLDRRYAEYLLQLSFYPVGSVVELADGAVGVVIATHMNRRDLNTPSRPVVAQLTTAHGQPLPVPRPLDLAQCEGTSIVRALPPVQGRQYLAERMVALM
ncbi:MAG: HD-GYP domain-containing protein [Gemmataceae bacterium]